MKGNRGQAAGGLFWDGVGEGRGPKMSKKEIKNVEQRSKMGEKGRKNQAKV